MMLGRKDGDSKRLPAHKTAPAKPSPEQEKLGLGWNHVVRGGRIVMAQSTTNGPPLLPPGTEGRAERHAAPAGGQRKPTHPEVSVVDSQPPSPKQTDATPRQPRSYFPLEGIVYLHENPSTVACVEMTRHFLSLAACVVAGEFRQRAVFEIVTLFRAVNGFTA
jgi:hypothetical protein